MKNGTSIYFNLFLLPHRLTIAIVWLLQLSAKKAHTIYSCAENNLFSTIFLGKKKIEKIINKFEWLLFVDFSILFIFFTS